MKGRHTDMKSRKTLSCNTHENIYLGDRNFIFSFTDFIF